MRTGVRRILGTLVAFVAAFAVLTPVDQARAAGRTPVVFVHGYTGNASNWATAVSLYRAAGYGGGELNAFEYDYNQDLEISAAQLKSYVDGVRARTGASKVDIVNHSMGGLVTRWYVQKLGGANHVAHVASLAGANHGTTFATACAIFPACVDMLPGSLFISRLSGDETPGSGKYATWYSPCDGVIIPYTSTTLSGATNNHVLCENHITYLTDVTILTEVRRFFAT